MSGIGGIVPGRDLGPAETEPDAPAQGVVSGEAQVTRGAAPGGRMAALSSVQVSGDYAREAKLLDAMLTKPAGELEKILAQARKEHPVEYRSALREFFKSEHLSEKSRLVLHNMAMDENNDGKLKFGEAYDTMRSMGFGRLRAFLLSGLTAVVLAPQTSDKGFTTTLDVAKSDKNERSFFGTGFDTVEQLETRLDQLMTYDGDKDGVLTLADMNKMVDDRTAKMDSKLGAKAINYLNKGEWQALFSLMDGRMTRDELRDFYAGSLFFSLLPADNLSKKLVDYRAKG